MSKVVANRMKKRLPCIIHYYQTGYVQDRYIGETVRSMFDIIEFTVNENVPGMLIFIDFQKAFNSLEWDFIFGCLEAFNFGPDFSRWVKTFYKNIQSCVINNGNVSDYFFLGRGVRQGDPLSPYLFVLAAEALAIALRQNVDIKDIFVDGQDTKLLQYADDMTAVLSDIRELTNRLLSHDGAVGSPYSPALSSCRNLNLRFAVKTTTFVRDRQIFLPFLKFVFIF